MPNTSNEINFNKLVEEIRLTRTELKNIIEACETRVLLKLETLNEKVKKLERENELLKHNFEIIERDAKQNNLLIYGLKLEQYNTTENICHTLQNTLEINITASDINNYYMLNIPNNPLKISLISGLKKKEILKNCRKLKGTDIIIRQDLTYKQRQDHKILRDHLKQARENKEIKSFIRGNNLYIGEKKYTVETLKNKNIFDRIRPNSEPSTPSNPSTTEINSPTFEKKSTYERKTEEPFEETPKLKNNQQKKSQTKIHRADEPTISKTRERLRSHNK